MTATIYAWWVRWFNDLPALSQPVRMALVAIMHVVLFSAAYLGSFMLRFDFGIPELWFETVWKGLGLVLGVKLILFGALKMYQGWWRYVSLYDLMALFRALLVAELVFIMVNVLTGLITLPRSIYVIDFGLSLILVGGARGSLRLMREAIHAGKSKGGQQQNVIVIGAGDTGETLLREISKNRNLPYKPIGFLDDDPRKLGLKIHNVSVLGRVDELKSYADKHNVSTVIIAMPSATREQMRRVVNVAKETGVEIKILPAVETMLSGGLATNQLREISLSDLLGRAPIRLDMQSLGTLLQGRRVMVTGAGGSIGSELCRQVLRFAPAELIMVERAETPLFFIHRELRADHDDIIIPHVASICDADRMRHIFEAHPPDVILHAAAYKHVPLMEANPCEAVKNNIRGTEVLTELAIKHQVSVCVLISTDKAVNPTSVMGATKRITELLLMAAHRREDNEVTRFCAVRFGNVLGSNGSVVPIFTEQIRRGGPITVTHPEMTRYFMTIPEAVQLVLQAGALGEGGEIFILDMGESVKIADLARDMIRLSGLSSEDIEVTFTGIRPGEKLFEELAINLDEMDTTRHDKIFVAPKESEGVDLLDEFYDRLLAVADLGDDQAARELLKQMIPTYHSPQLPRNVVPLRKKQPTNETQTSDHA